MAGVRVCTVSWSATVWNYEPILFSHDYCAAPGKLNIRCENVMVDSSLNQHPRMSLRSFHISPV